MNEDSLYRFSTQYRFWSFTHQTLTALRHDTNRLATARVLAAQAESAQQSTSSAPATSPSSGNTSEAEKNGGPRANISKPKPKALKAVRPLTASEELEVIKYYCEKINEKADEFTPPLASSIRATAIQYLHRFYVSQSAMSHQPLRIMKCALFFALKTDGAYMDLDKFLPVFPGTTRADILDLEYLLMRTLRYTMDVRHPFRGLDGGVMELNAIANGEAEAVPGSPLSAAELKRDLLAIEPLPGQAKARNMSTRISNAATKAKEVLKTAAVLTDAYFLYTPSQIWLAALLMFDKPLVTFYLNSKFPSSSSQTLLSKVLKTITACAQLLESYQPISEADLKQLKGIGKRVRDIEKMWETFPRHGVKRADEDNDLEVEATAKKKRRLEREKGEREGDVFGGPIGKKDDKGGGGGGGGEWSD